MCLSFWIHYSDIKYFHRTGWINFTLWKRRKLFVNFLLTIESLQTARQTVGFPTESLARNFLRKSKFSQHFSSERTHSWKKKKNSCWNGRCLLFTLMNPTMGSHSFQSLKVNRIRNKWNKNTSSSNIASIYLFNDC